MKKQRSSAVRPWPPRFSLRSLVIIVTLVCIYLGVWEITKTWVVDDLISDRGLRCESPVPFVVVIDEIDYLNNRYIRRYHFCCLALMVRLPYAHECHDRQPLIMGGVIPQIIIQEEEEDRLGVASP